MQLAFLGTAFGVFVAACGGGDAPPPPRPARPADVEPAAVALVGGAAAAQPGQKQLLLYEKIPEEFRRELTDDEFKPDSTGNVNRDPFRNFLVNVDALGTRMKAKEGNENECSGRKIVAPEFGLRDLKFTGVVREGTIGYVNFTDLQRRGYTARRGDCFAKEQARLKEIQESTIIVEIRGEAPPGAPAPPPRVEVWRLHPDDLKLESGSPTNQAPKISKTEKEKQGT